VSLLLRLELESRKSPPLDLGAGVLSSEPSELYLSRSPLVRNGSLLAEYDERLPGGEAVAKLDAFLTLLLLLLLPPLPLMEVPSLARLRSSS
jgi:hypothetical protein